MDIIKNAYLYIYLVNEIEYSECFNEKNERFQINNFYRNNPIYSNDIITDIKKKANINVKLDEYFFFTIDYHRNFHHAMVEMIGQLQYYINLNKKIKILIKPNKFIYEYLELLSFIDVKNIEIIEYDKLYYFEKLYVNKISVKTKIFVANLIKINKYLTLSNSMDEYPEKIFIYRQNNKRQLTTINDIIEIAKKNNFYIYSPENDNLNNQIQLISNCKILLCELGAGCSNIFFTNPKCKIIIMSFLKGWSDKYLFYNRGILDRNISVLNGKLICGNEHNCTWYFDKHLLIEKINELNQC